MFSIVILCMLGYQDDWSWGTFGEGSPSIVVPNPPVVPAPPDNKAPCPCDKSGCKCAVPCPCNPCSCIAKPTVKSFVPPTDVYPGNTPGWLQLADINGHMWYSQDNDILFQWVWAVNTGIKQAKPLPSMQVKSPPVSYVPQPQIWYNALNCST